MRLKAAFLSGIFLAVTAQRVPYTSTKQKHITVPSPPDPEPIEVIELPLPPVTPDETEGGSSLVFTGAPAAPDPASIYNGLHLIIVRANGTHFPNGDPWKCITCGVPADQQYGLTSTMDYQYPQAFTDGTRILAGAYIIDCGTAQLASPECTPDKVHIYPIRWNTTPNGNGSGGSIRELRKHPDDVHLSFNVMSYTTGTVSQYAYFARLQFDPAPKTGTPLAPRYDLVNVTLLYDPTGEPPLSANGSHLTINRQSISVGEARGLSGLGDQIDYVGFPAESCNVDIFGVNLKTGEVMRVTYGPEYVDPMDTSSDGKWVVIMDTTTSNRMMFLAGMRGVPPLVDTLITGAISSIRNNGHRRFFQPWIFDRHGAREDKDGRNYQGQQINACGGSHPGSVNDPLWNGGADPRFSLDGTKIAYFQLLVQTPDCGGSNPLPCPNSTEPGHRTERLMMATLSSREPIPWAPMDPVSDAVPWGQPYVPGRVPPDQALVPFGNFTLSGQVSGHAKVSFIANSAGTTLETVLATYYNYSDDGDNFIMGTEKVSTSYPNMTLIHVDWFSDLHSTGIHKSFKVTSPGGFHFDIDIENNKFYANGTLITTVDGVVYRQPANAT